MGFITPNALYLCLDQGGHASRAIVFNRQGKMVSSAYCDVETEYPAKHYVELNAQAVIESINTSIKQVLAHLGEKKNHIVSAGLATQRSNIVCWNKKTGEALSPVISWQDRRNNEWLAQFNDKNEYIHKKTGLFLSPHYGASKLRWCIDHIPEVKKALNDNTLVFGPMASFIVFHLVKEKFLLADPVNASRTQLWNLKKHNWDEELLELFGIPLSALPHCVPSIHHYGTIELDELNIPLRLVTGDQSAAMYAYGQLQPDTAYVNTGTGAFLSRSSGPLALYSRRLLTSLIFRDSELKSDSQNHFVLEGTVNGAGSALDWLSKQYPDTNIYEFLSEWLNEVETPPLFLNGISGLGAPFWLADFISQFNREANLNEKAVAVVESIVFLLITCLDEMTKLSSPPEQIQITGGLASQNGLNQRIADLSGLPVYRPTDCEATARGTAYLLADQPTHWPEQDAGEWFEPEDNPAFKSRYAEWMKVMLENMRNK
jgi:glycerol kinase